MVSTSPDAAATSADRRGVGRPRQYGDAVESQLIVDAGYAALRQHGADLTIAHILAEAGVSTRSFYRHFVSKDALLCALYRRESDRVSSRLTERVRAAGSAVEGVVGWIDEVFGFTRSARRAERVSVLGSAHVQRADGLGEEAAAARTRLIEPLRTAIAAGVHAGLFLPLDPDMAAEMVAVSVLHAAGVSDPFAKPRAQQNDVVAFCLRALGADSATDLRAT